MVRFQLSMCTMVLIGAALKASALEKYTAAVYAHAVILTGAAPKLVTREKAVQQMNKNLDVFEEVTKTAAAMGSHIIVLPEDGIYGWVFERETLYPYLEDIPDPQVNWIPCIDPQRFGSSEVQERLSCMARNYSIYVVANMGDKKSCNSTDPKCPKDGHYQYNTDVVYDPEGKFLARYHKYNLFESETPYFDFAKEPQFVNFNTSFGRFGIITCADILNFREPAVSLVESFKDEVFTGTIYFDDFTFTELSQEAGNHTVCQKGLCCHLSYKMAEKCNDEVYAFGAFDGLHVIEGEYYLQICTLVKCNTTDLKSCGQEVDTARTKFDYFSLSGTFKTSYVFPEVLLTGTQLAPGEFEELDLLNLTLGITIPGKERTWTPGYAIS
ncbi:UNVERIFIED_CONTAM: hypothetical protein K2H54_073581 [Gekko kuhli]